MDRFRSLFRSQLFNLITQQQLFTLQLGHVQSVCRRMMLGIFKLLFQCLVAAFQFDEMIMQRHPAIPF